MRNRGEIKVMVGKNGQTRVQETLGDSVKVYSAEDWKEELERRAELEKKPKKVKVKPEEPEEVKVEVKKTLGAKKTKK